MKQSPHYEALILAWIIFGLVHSVLAGGMVKRFMSVLMKDKFRYYRAIYSLVVAITLFILIHYHFAAIDTIMWRPRWFEKIPAGILVIGGFVIMVICIWKYFLDLSGLGVILRPDLPPLELQTDGLHAYVRHPLYTGTIFFIWGVFLGYPYMNNLISAICLTVYTLIGIYFEEKKLVEAYGDRYREYQSRVPMLLPI